jgi:glutaredoxin 3
MDIDYEEIDVTHDHEERMALVERTGKRTVPQIFIRDESIGGYTDLKALKDSGKLDELFPG